MRWQVGGFGDLVRLDPLTGEFRVTTHVNQGSDCDVHKRITSMYHSLVRP